VSAFKFTPGPWTAHKDGSTVEFGEGDERRTLLSLSLRPSNDEMRATAKILAAVPDMVGVLRAIIKQHDKDASASDETCGFTCGCVICELATDALRKGGVIP